MTAPNTVIVAVANVHAGLVSWTVADALAIAAQILAQAGPLVYAKADLAEAQRHLARVRSEEDRSAAIRRRGLRRPVGAA